MKKILLSVLTVMLAAVLCLGVFASNGVEIKMTIGENVGYVNGEAKELDAAPIIRGNRTMLPVRFVAENLGATVAWDPTTSTAILSTDDVEIKITIGAATATVNGEEVALDAPAFIENSRTYLPVRFVAEKLGATVTWDGETSTATITLGDVFVPFPDDYTVAYPDGFNYSSADLTQYVKLGQYKDLNLEIAEPAEVTDEEVDAYIAKLLEESPLLKEVNGRAAENGDIVNVNFVGKIDGVAFEGGSAEDYQLIIGSGLFIDGFEDGIIGMNIGETKNVEVVFPANYDAELAGKTAVFEITLLSIYEEVPAENLDEYIKASTAFGSIEEFKAAIKEELQEERETEAANAAAEIILGAVVASSEIVAYPDGLVEDYMYQSLSYIKKTCAEYGMTYETLISCSGYTVEDYETLTRASVENTVKQELVIMAIAQAEGLVPTKEERDAEVLMYAMYYGCEDITEVATMLGVSYDYLLNIIEYSIALENVNAFLAANN
ncbi:MAG: trigger factor [Clostridia bacterium]|nr:trigger factor [Clostridia bacterium]